MSELRFPGPRRFGIACLGRLAQRFAPAADDDARSALARLPPRHRQPQALGAPGDEGAGVVVTRCG